MSDYKMAIVVRTDLGMGKGKIAGQAGHAVADLIFIGHRKAFNYVDEHDAYEDMFQSYFNRAMSTMYGWYANGREGNQKKIILRCSSEQEILNLAEKCVDAGLDYTVIHDAGHTQIAPNTITCIGIGPDTSERIDAVCGDLKLL